MYVHSNFKNKLPDIHSNVHIMFQKTDETLKVKVKDKNIEFKFNEVFVFVFVKLINCFYRGLKTKWNTYRKVRIEKYFIRVC